MNTRKWTSGRLASAKRGPDEDAVDRWLAAAVENRLGTNEIVGTAAAVGRLETNDIDQLATLVQPWDVQLDQISPGGFRSYIDFVKLPGMMVYQEGWLRAVKARGSTPKGLFMFGTNLGWRLSRVDWCGRTLSDRLIACAGPDVEVDFLVPDLDHHVVLLIEPEHLAAAIGEEAVELVGRRRHLSFSATDGERFISAMTGILRAYATAPEALIDDPREAAHARSWLLEALSSCLSHAATGDAVDSMSLREASVRRAMGIADRAAHPITALELAEAVGVSQRTLEHGFREVLGMTPGAYLRRLRMNRVHHNLAAADPRSNTVGEIAKRWNFSDLSRLGIEYRSLFGEKPSQTLQKNSRSQGGSSIASSLATI